MPYMDFSHVFADFIIDGLQRFGLFGGRRRPFLLDLFHEGAVNIGDKVLVKVDPRVDRAARETKVLH